MLCKGAFLVFALGLTIVRGASFYSSGFGNDGVVILGDQVRCGSLACPPESTGCFLQKKTDPNNTRFVNVLQRCVGRGGAVTKETNERVEVQDGQYYDTVVSIGNGGFNNVIVGDNLDPEKKAEIERQVHQLTSQINQEVQANVGQALRDLDKRLKHLDDILRNI
ncbi:uncharacterized protein LOC119649289 [Hermetia illucens]|uniref:uncharacterized protein LOC119649289 n=1 Tax=Hermetia illucens TaxID=343691 RepID=UPI0018CC0522|nr:uncharacterized protein LOC119649289 [Hermetia illucens]XP_037907311.1 uncharacterized protein LOC119649289 [Hermetia illucens]